MLRAALARQRWRMVPVPRPPTAHTSFGPLPQTSKSSGPSFEIGDAVADHATPSQCKIAPPTPTAQTSLGSLPQTPLKAAPNGVNRSAICCATPDANFDQLEPFQ